MAKSMTSLSNEHVYIIMWHFVGTGNKLSYSFFFHIALVAQKKKILDILKNTIDNIKSYNLRSLKK